MVLRGKQTAVGKSKFTFKKVNEMYFYLGLAGLAIASLNKGLARLTHKMSNWNHLK